MSTERFVAHGRAMRALVEQIRRFATIDSNVLISGETGTGKNAVARELQHVVERALAASDGGDVTLRHLSNEILDGPALRPDDVAGRRPTLEQVERRYIAATLQHARGNRTRAAQLLGISRKALWEKRKRYGLD